MQHDPSKDPDDRDALENLVVAKEYVKHEGTWLDPQAAKDGAIKALGALYDQIDWIEKGIVEWREVAQQNGKRYGMAQATARVAITHLQAVLNGRLDANQMLAAEKAARDWLESIGEET